MNGHPVDKIELLVLGGTWTSYPHQYQVPAVCCRVCRAVCLPVLDFVRASFYQHHFLFHAY